MWPGAAVLLVAAGIAALLLLPERRGGGLPSLDGAGAARATTVAARYRRFQLRPESGAAPVRIAFRRPPRAGILFDLRSGAVLWHRRAKRRLPIASLTKMMTGLLIAERHGLREKVRITRQALAFKGSGMGVLPHGGRRVRLNTLLNGLLLVSGNDAAIALAQHDARTVPRFVARMNRRARAMGLRCTRFSSPHGFEDRGNHSCAADLAVLARADLANRRVRRIAGRHQIGLHFPIRGGRLLLYNNNPLIRIGEPGITGLKTGFTARAGRCYVVTARHGGRYLGVVLLHSPNPLPQIRALLRAGARAPR